MIRVRVFSDFCTSDVCRCIFERIWPSTDQLTWVSDTSFTNILLLNHATPKFLTLPKEKVIGLAYEPPEILGWTAQQLAYVKEHCGLYLVGSSLGGSESPFFTHHGFLWHLPKSTVTEKHDFMSIIVSDKKWAPGHKYRHVLIEAILKTNLPIHIYGRGCPSGSDSRLKGQFVEREPYDSYRFHIAIENYETEAYFSEKVSNCLMTSTTPIYLGAKFLPFEDSVLRLSGTLQTDLDLLTNIVADPDSYQKTLDPERLFQHLDIRPFLLSRWT